VNSTIPPSVEERPAEKLLIQFAAQLPSGPTLTNTIGRAQFATQFARRHPDSPVTCWLLDLYQTQQITASQVLPPNLQLTCTADPSLDPVELVAWSFTRQGNGELVREMLQMAHQRLTLGGCLVAAIDNASDRWLHKLLQDLFGKVTRQPSQDGVLYVAHKASPLKKLKNYAAQFAFRDGPRLIHLQSRPGVFSHRELDGGARALIKSMTVCSEAKVLDLGSGSGAVGIAAALRAENVQVDAIDANPRAVESTLASANRNDVPSLKASLDCDGRTVTPRTYDLVLANPPYFSHFRIARLFVEIAHRALKPEGVLILVTKTPQWYLDHLPGMFESITTQTTGHYHVVISRATH
jgi:16S rRNA (guanine1207-N2)-methyltransferase